MVLLIFSFFLALFFCFELLLIGSLLKLLDKLCHEQQKTILMVSHDITAIRQTAHRMVYLEETIRYDGPTENFPDLTSLAGLRGITPVHDDKHTIEPHDHNKCMEEE